MKAIFDTPILIDQLKSIDNAFKILSQYEELYISIITKIEVMTGIRTSEELRKAHKLFSLFEIYHTNDDIADIAAGLRCEKKLKTPDAIIYATAKHLNAKLVTRNSNDFSEGWGDVVVPYTV